jgi:hypothetical protein
MGAGEPIEPGVAPLNSAGHGNSQHGSQFASTESSPAAQPAEPDIKPANEVGQGNAQHATNPAAANASAAAEPPEPAPATGDEGSAFAFHFKNQGGPFNSTTTVEFEELNSSPLHPDHHAELAAIPEIDPPAVHENAVSPVDNGQRPATGHLLYELLT